MRTYTSMPFDHYVMEEPNTGCHIWVGSRAGRGYGRVWQAGRMRPAHRVAWERAFGDVPAGLVIDHLCRQPACVNPKHMEPVTTQANILRGQAPTAIHAKKQACPKCGGPYTLYRNRERLCRACRKAYLAGYYKAHRRITIEALP